MSSCTFSVGEFPTLQLPTVNGFAWPRTAPRTLSTVLVVEHRDEVFARIQADLAAWGIRVERATGAEEARRHYCRRPTGLILVHADLPDETGWLFACKLRLGRPAARIWVYTPRRTTKELVLAEFIGVEETIAYGGDLLRLAAEIVDRLVTSSLPIPPPFAPAERKSPRASCLADISGYSGCSGSGDDAEDSGPAIPIRAEKSHSVAEPEGVPPRRHGEHGGYCGGRSSEKTRLGRAVDGSGCGRVGVRHGVAAG